MSDFLRFANISKTYDGINYVIENLNLTVNQGEFLTFLGPSGSGKTTALMMLAGFEHPSSGQIWLNGSDIAQRPAHKRGLGVVFQNYALFPHMTIRENVAFPLRARRMARSAIDRLVDEALELAQIKSLADRRPGQLSGGQQQRSALARALVFGPEIVIMDEPLGALDKNLRENMQVMIKDIHRNSGATILYVTHDQAEALTMSDRIAVFERGQIVQLDSPREVYERPRNEFVAGFLGDINFLPATVLARGTQDMGTVMLPGNRLVTATLPEEFAPGARVLVAVRPETLRLANAEDRNQGRCLTTTVQTITYCGSHARIMLSDEHDLQFKMQIGVRETEQLKLGQKVDLGWAAGCLTALRSVS